MQLLTILSLLLLAAVAHAETVSLTVDTAGSYAVSNNLALRASRFALDEARGRLLQSGRLENPELESGFIHNTETPERAWELSLTQRFPITSRLRHEKEVSRAELAAAEHEIKDAERRLVAQVRAGLVRLLANQSQRALREEQRRNAEELAAFLERRVESGEGPAQDALLSDLETRQIETELLQLEVERSTTLSELLPALGLQAGDELRAAGSLSTPPATPPAVKGDPNQRPDLRAAASAEAAAQSAVSLEKSKRWDDVALGVIYESEFTDDAPEGFEDDSFVGFRVSVPLPLWNNNRGSIQEASARAERRAAETASLASVIGLEIETAQREMATLAQLARQIEQSLLPKAREIEDRFRSDNTLGQAPISEVFRARDKRLQLERQRVDIVRDYHLARVRFEAASGFVPAPSARKGSAKALERERK